MSNYSMLEIKEQIKTLSIEIEDTEKNRVLCLGLKGTAHISGMTILTLRLGHGSFFSLEHPSLSSAPF